MDKFANKEWGDFLLLDFFTYDKGDQNNMASLTAGNIPLVSARKCDNGYKDFVSTNGKKHFRGGILTLNNDGDGGVGYAYYQPHEFLLDTHVWALFPKEELSRHKLLFIAMCITKQRPRFGHGYPINEKRLKSFKIMLPLAADGKTPDWSFMEAYMRQKEQEILKPTIEKLCKHLIISGILGGGKSLRSNWKEYIFGDEFDIQSTGSGIDKNKLVQGDGETPYVTRTDTNNGIDTFIGKQADRYKVDEGNVITIGLDTQTVFYQPKPFYTGQNIQVIRHDKLNRHNAMFLIVAIKKLVEKFSWGSYGATLTRLKKSRLYLPADESGEIDFAFMTSFMQDVERDILSTTLKHFKARVSVNETKSGG